MNLFKEKNSRERKTSETIRFQRNLYNKINKYLIGVKDNIMSKLTKNLENNLLQKTRKKQKN